MHDISPSRSAAAKNPTVAQVDIVRHKGEFRVITWYKNHAFDAHYTTEQFRMAEFDGTLTWDGSGNPIIRDMTGNPPEPPRIQEAPAEPEAPARRKTGPRYRRRVPPKKLSEEDAETIRRERSAKPPTPVKELAERFGVSQGLVSNIANGIARAKPR